jgi:hypothetical protein
LPKTSFRLHLAMNTLVVGWTLPAVRARWGLTPVRIRSCWANNTKKEDIHMDTLFSFVYIIFIRSNQELSLSESASYQIKIINKTVLELIP